MKSVEHGLWEGTVDFDDIDGLWGFLRDFLDWFNGTGHIVSDIVVKLEKFKQDKSKVCSGYNPTRDGGWVCMELSQSGAR